MSFFGFEQNNLEKEKQKFLDSGLHESEDLAVYTWGEESYDGLGDALQEGGDELNDETFGVGNVGKDFDFSQSHYHDSEHSSRDSAQSLQFTQEQAPLRLEVKQDPSFRPTQPSRSTTHSLEAIWDDKSIFSVLPRADGVGRTLDSQPVSPAPSLGYSAFASNVSPGYTNTSVSSHSADQGQSRVRTLEEIEAEMHSFAQQSRAAQQQQELLQQQQLQQELLRRKRREEELRLSHEQELQQQLYQQQQQIEQLQLQRLLQQQQFQQQHTPPPRMLPTSHSPRIFEHQRQLRLQQQQFQEQQQMQEIQDQLRIAELERQMRVQMTLQHNQSRHEYAARRPINNVTPPDIQITQVLQQQHQQQLHHLHQQTRRQRSQSPAIGNGRHIPEGVAYHPQNIQMQQKILSEMAQADVMRDLQGPNSDQEALRAEAMRKIVEAEKMEERRRKKAAKIAHMARYNDIMTQSDKDFITRIQVSQLVTQDPYADDFYAQVYGAILRSKMGLQSQDERVIKFGSGGGIGLGLTPKGGGRRQSAMQRMEQQVERIVSNARRREEEKGLHSLHSLQGALGRTSGRSYKAAPRQLLQVDASNPSGSPIMAPAHAHITKASVSEGAAKQAAKLGREALGNAADTDNLVRKEPLTQRQILTVLELLYDLVLKLEQLRRDQPLPEEEEASQFWQREYDALVDQIWEEMRVMVPLETSDPHPFVSLLTPSKGKKILPRLTRHLNSQRMLTLLTLLVACFTQLDVVKQAGILDSLEDTTERADVDRQTQAFLGSVMQSILPVVSVANLRLVTGLLGLLLDRSNIVAVAQTRPGLALLTLFLSRVEVIKQTMATTADMVDVPTPEEAQQWQLMFDHLFQLLAPHLSSLFPSTRMTDALNPSNAANPDIVDQPVWQFLAALALHAVLEQHQVLVSSLREKILPIVFSVNKGLVNSAEERQTKLANVNLFLHAVGLDSSQIAM